MLQRLGPIDSADYTTPRVTFTIALEQEPKMILDIGDYQSFQRLLDWLNQGALDRLHAMIDKLAADD